MTTKKISLTLMATATVLLGSHAFAQSIAPASPFAPGSTAVSKPAPAPAAPVPEPVMCTMDAKQCPDGSWVGRSGPNCSFVCPATPTPTAPAPSSLCPSIDRNLSSGVRHTLVTQLQQYLATRGYLSAQVTGYFGPSTMQAVKAFQRAEGLPATGFVGALTRASLQNCSQPQPSAVRIYSITPTAGPVGTQVTIDGFGFTSDNTIHFGYGVVMHVPSSGGIAIACTTDPSCIPGIHQHITFTVPSSLDPACRFSFPVCAIASRMTTPGNYDVSVQNSNGTSNAKTFTVTGGTSASPRIDTETPVTGPTGTQVTLTGVGLTQDRVLRFGVGSIPFSASADGTSLTFTVPTGVGPYCEGGMMCPMYFMQVTPGTYGVYAQNTDGSVVSNTVSFTVTQTQTNTLSVSGIDAPASLKAGQSGTWTLRVTTSFPNLRYSVVWGDEQQTYQMGMRPYLTTTVQSTGTFTHAYQFPGTYSPVFAVTNDSGQSTSASASVRVSSAY